MINIAICDDEKAIVNLIEKLIHDVRGKESAIKIDTFSSGKALEESVLKDAKYDIIYLDIHMEDGEAEGIEVANNIRTVDENVIIIFVSANEQHAFDAYLVNPLYFLVKPIDVEKFGEIYNRAIQKNYNKKAYFIFSFRRRMKHRKNR